jgi:hypothetical protein
VALELSLVKSLVSIVKVILNSFISKALDFYIHGQLSGTILLDLFIDAWTVFLVQVFMNDFMIKNVKRQEFCQ